MTTAAAAHLKPVADSLMATLIDEGIVAAEVLADILARERAALTRGDLAALSGLAREKQRSASELETIRNRLLILVKSRGATAQPLVHRKALAALLGRCQQQHAVNAALVARLLARHDAGAHAGAH